MANFKDTLFSSCFIRYEDIWTLQNRKTKNPLQVILTTGY